MTTKNIVQCASSKDPAAGSLRTRSDELVTFVAHPDTAPQRNSVNYAGRTTLLGMAQPHGDTFCRNTTLAVPKIHLGSSKLINCTDHQYMESW